jgi:serine O-acetyltransferase
MNVINLQRTANYLLKRNIPVLPKLIYYIQFFMFNSSIPPQVEIGKGTKCAYGGIGTVIHERSKIGDDCMIGQGVTIGGRSRKVNVPVIGNRVYIGAGARILGDVNIADDVVIGANSVVLNDLPSRTVAVGVPAKIIKTNINPSDFF